MAVGDVFYASIHFNVAGNAASVGFYFEQFDVNDGDDPNSAITLALAPLIPALKSEYSNQVQFSEIRSVSLPGVSKPPSLTLPIGEIGLVPSDALPLTKAAMITLEQTDRDARHNGRNFWPGIPESSTDVNTITSVLWVPTMAAVYQQIEILTFTINDVVYEFFHVLRNRGQTPEFVRVRETIVTDTLFNQRRRLTEASGLSQ